MMVGFCESLMCNKGQKQAEEKGRSKAQVDTMVGAARESRKFHWCEAVKAAV